MSAKPKSPAPPMTPEEYLWQATRAKDTSTRLSMAQLGLAIPADELHPETHLLLLRQLYLVKLELGRLGEARGIAEQMVQLGVMRDTASHELSRVLFALGELDLAIVHQRQAARQAPPSRRSFHFWCLGTWQEHAGQPADAIESMERGLRWAQRDRALLEAHSACLKLGMGTAVQDLKGYIARLLSSANREGYGRYLVGRIFEEMGDHRQAAVHLRAFLNRNASIDRAKGLTLRRELDYARDILARQAS